MNPPFTAASSIPVVPMGFIPVVRMPSNISGYQNQPPTFYVPCRVYPHPPIPVPPPVSLEPKSQKVKQGKIQEQIFKDYISVKMMARVGTVPWTLNENSGPRLCHPPPLPPYIPRHPLYEKIISKSFCAGYSHHQIKLNHFYYPLPIQYCNHHKNIHVQKFSFANAHDAEVAQFNATRILVDNFGPKATLNPNTSFQSLWCPRRKIRRAVVARLEPPESNTSLDKTKRVKKENRMAVD